MSWPSQLETEPKKYFTRKVQELGTSENSVGLLELDRTLIGLAIQIAVEDNVIDKEETNDIKQRADEQLFKPNARTFILINKSNGTLTMYGEPTLLSERQGPGKLVGMSMVAARGIAEGNMGLVIFEDRVCENDLGFSIKFPNLFGSTYDRSNMFQTRTCSSGYNGEFYFGKGSDILTVIAAPYSQNITPPINAQAGAAPKSESRVQAENSNEMEKIGNLIALANLAVDIVKLISRR